MTITLAQIYRHPVKGLTPERLTQVALSPGEGLPHDRRFALARGSTSFDPTAPVWLPKTNFLMLMRDESLARLRTHFDELSNSLTIGDRERVLLRADLGDPAGRQAVADFFARYMGDAAEGPPKLVEAPGHMFSDGARKVVSIIGLPSLRDLESAIGHKVDPRRFRANFYLDGGAPWQEFAWVGREFRVGTVLLRGVKPIKRCAATNVDPDTGQRDLNLPRALQERYGHVNTGIYADVIAGGAVALGDELNLSA